MFFLFKIPLSFTYRDYVPALLLSSSFMITSKGYAFISDWDLSVPLARHQIEGTNGLVSQDPDSHPKDTGDVGKQKCQTFEATSGIL